MPFHCDSFIYNNYLFNELNKFFNSDKFRFKFFVTLYDYNYYNYYKNIIWLLFLD